MNRPRFTGTRRYMAAQRRSGIIRALAPAALIVTLAWPLPKPFRGAAPPGVVAALQRAPDGLAVRSG